MWDSRTNPDSLIGRESRFAVQMLASVQVRTLSPPHSPSPLKCAAYFDNQVLSRRLAVSESTSRLLVNLIRQLRETEFDSRFRISYG